MADISLGDVALIVDCEHKTAPKAPPGEEFGYSVGTRSIRGGQIDFDSCKRVSKSTFASWSQRAVPAAGDLILAREAPVGQVGYVDGRRPVCLGQRTVLIRPGERANGRFLHYLLLAPAAQGWMSEKSAGSTVEHLNVADIRRLPLGDLPSVAEQRRIAGVLGALDDLAMADRQLVGVLGDMAAASFEELMSGAREAGRYREVAFADTVRIWSGGTPKTSVAGYWDGNIPWFSVVDAPAEGEIWVRTTARNTTAVGVRNSATQVLPARTVILSARGTVGRIAMTSRPMAMNQSCYGLTSNSGRAGYFTYFSTRSLVRILKQHAHGSVFSTITRSNFAGVMIDLPEPDLVEVFESQVGPIMEGMLELLEEIADLQKVRDELLPLLMSGRVRVGEVTL